MLWQSSKHGDRTSFQHCSAQRRSHELLVERELQLNGPSGGTTAAEVAGFPPGARHVAATHVLQSRSAVR